LGTTHVARRVDLGAELIETSGLKQKRTQDYLRHLTQRIPRFRSVFLTLSGYPVVVTLKYDSEEVFHRLRKN